MLHDRIKYTVAAVLNFLRCAEDFHSEPFLVGYDAYPSATAALVECSEHIADLARGSKRVSLHSRYTAPRLCRCAIYQPLNPCHAKALSPVQASPPYMAQCCGGVRSRCGYCEPLWVVHSHLDMGDTGIYSSTDPVAASCGNNFANPSGLKAARSSFALRSH